MHRPSFRRLAPGVSAMKAAADKVTGDLLPDHDLVGERARPLTKQQKAAARVAKMRADRGLRALTVNLPADLIDQFHAKRKERGQTTNEAIEKLLRTQFLRKR